MAGGQLDRHVRWIDYRQSALHGNPDPSPRVADYRPASIDSFAARQTIGRAIFADVSRSSVTREQLVSWHLQDVTRSRYPKSSFFIFRDAEYGFAQNVWQGRNLKFPGDRNARPEDVRSTVLPAESSKRQFTFAEGRPSRVL